MAREFGQNSLLEGKLWPRQWPGPGPGSPAMGTRGQRRCGACKPQLPQVLAERDHPAPPPSPPPQPRARGLVGPGRHGFAPNVYTRAHRALGPEGAWLRAREGVGPGDQAESGSEQGGAKMTREPGRLNAGLCCPCVRGPGSPFRPGVYGAPALGPAVHGAGGRVDGRRERLVRGQGRARLASWDLSSQARRTGCGRTQTSGGRMSGERGGGSGLGPQGRGETDPRAVCRSWRGSGVCSRACTCVRMRACTCVRMRVCTCVSTGVRRAQLTQCTRPPLGKRPLCRKGPRL